MQNQFIFIFRKNNTKKTCNTTCAYSICLMSHKEVNMNGYVYFKTSEKEVVISTSDTGRRTVMIRTTRKNDKTRIAGISFAKIAQKKTA